MDEFISKSSVKHVYWSHFKGYDIFRTYEAPKQDCGVPRAQSQIWYSTHVILEHNKAAEPECLICGQWDALSRDINKCRPYCMHSHVGRAWAELLNSRWSLLVNPQSQIPSIHSRKTPDLENQVVHSNWNHNSKVGRATHQVFHYLWLLAW